VVTCPIVHTYCRAAACQTGAAAARSGVSKRAKYNPVGAASFVPPVSRWPPQKSGIAQHDLFGKICGASSTFSKTQVVANALCELSVCLCLWNARLEWALAGFFARVFSTCFMQGLPAPCVDSTDADW
jgi:hypothetical protein